MNPKKVTDSVSRRQTPIQKLLSIHMTSNRPDQLVRFLDLLAEKTTDMGSVEVVIKIDDDDPVMNALLKKEAARQPFRITYISTPLEGGFYGLWKCYDELLQHTDPNAYFVVGLNDEMYFLDEGWDERLGKYVGLFPDGIYRLRTSMHRERHTFDYWEAGCAGDLTPFMTKRWLDLSGGWCPCNGPDSFQNTVAYYFGWLYRHDTFGRPYRERVVHDVRLGGEGANEGVEEAALRHRLRGGVIPWFRLVSWRMQTEAARRAQRLHAHIWAIANGVTGYEVVDDARRQNIMVTNADGKPIRSSSYRLSRLRIGLTNAWRTLRYPYFMGAGELWRHSWWRSIKYFVLLRYRRLDDFNRGRIAARDDVAGRVDYAKGREKVRPERRIFQIAYTFFRPIYALIGKRK
jgi:hypothetical protein